MLPAKPKRSITSRSRYFKQPLNARDRQGGTVNRKLIDEVAALEETQEAHRESIKQTKALAEKADKLVKKHKANLKDQEPVPRAKRHSRAGGSNRKDWSAFHPKRARSRNASPRRGRS